MSSLLRTLWGPQERVARQERLVTCLQASQGKVMVHVDVSALGSPSPASYEGLCRDNFGRWLMGFYGDARVVDNLKEELLAILHGMKLAWRANFRNILCVSDSLLAVNLVLGPLDVFHSMLLSLLTLRSYYNNLGVSVFAILFEKETKVQIFCQN
ncbi:uncharacterized protein LOC109807072 [Cajanus cajan]|uniref:uncharacterized protein LOC109807072 n=1 Tax=Cajanus cajan TaxID=3821 RepID=UPI00098D86CE|nr:uncharacterized protein LOC109807072 [Cajanus cajan]